MVQPSPTQDKPDACGHAAFSQGPCLQVSEAVARCRAITGGICWRSKIYRWMSSGQLAYVQLDRRKLIPEKALLEFLARRYVPARPSSVEPAHQ